VVASSALAIGAGAGCLLLSCAFAILCRRRKPRHRGAFHGDYSSDPGAFLYMDPTGTQITSPLRDSMPEELETSPQEQRGWGFSIVTPKEVGSWAPDEAAE